MKKVVSVLTLGMLMLLSAAVFAEGPSSALADALEEIRTGEAFEGLSLQSWPRNLDGKCECPPGFDCSDLPSKYSDGCPMPGMDWKFVSVSSLLVGTTALDMESTFYALDRCPNCYEANPIVRPFVNRGRGATYAFGMGLNTLSLWGAYDARKRGKWWWWIPPIASSAVHVWAAHHNYGLVR